MVRTFTPFDAAGHLTVPVANRLTGHCWEISLAAPAARSYRCLAGNRILDPCFAATTHAHAIACLADPWGDAIVLRLTQPLPSDTPSADAMRPWALVLAAKDGPLRCVAITGTAPFVNGVGLPYACADGSYAALRNPAADQVRAVVGRLRGHVLHTADVTMLWHG